MRSLTLPAETFRKLAHDLTNFAADYLEKLPELPSYPSDISGQEAEHLFGGEIPLDVRSVISEVLAAADELK